MKKLIVFVLFFLSLKSFPQNIVPNWSFEDTLNCPNNLDQIYKASGWTAYRESPDYFSSCSPFVQFPGISVSVPSNYWSFQYAKTGNAYSGIITYSKASNNLREYIGIELVNSLSVGEKYYTSFYVSRAVTTTHSSMNIATNNIGIRLLKSSFTSLNAQPIDNYSQVFTNSIIVDTLNWIKISGSFVADSAYSYLSIGNFFNDSLTSIIAFDSTSTYAYYYIDDIRLSTDSSFTNLSYKANPNNTINILPNPSRDWIEVRGNDIKSITFYNFYGKIIYEDPDFISPNRLNISFLPSGIYFLSIKTTKQLILRKVIKE